MKYTKMHSKIYLATTVLHKSAFIERKFRYILKKKKKNRRGYKVPAKVNSYIHKLNESNRKVTSASVNVSDSMPRAGNYRGV